ncbi:MAG: DoxX family protein [Alphaproteobacteria bacterium]|nr:DoxX family protein [Alphaproteobacteria bacterium]
MPANYPVVDAGLRLAMALLFLVSATTKVTETSAIQAYMQAYGMPGMLVWPAACFEYAAGLCLFLGYWARPVATLLAVWCMLTALIFHRQFSDLDQLMNFFKNLRWQAALYGWPRLTRAARASRSRRRPRLAGGKPCGR